MAKSIINADGSVDISRLEREIKQDLSLYRKHAAEDGMKKKAIHTSTDYDEFKNFVSAAELKPTTSRDVSSLFTGGLGSISRSSNAGCRDVDRQAGGGIIGGYGESIQRRKDLTADLNKPSCIVSMKASSHTGTRSTADDFKRPAGKTDILAKKSSREVHDFVREWEKQCKSPEATVAFLTRIRNSDTSDSGMQKRLVLSPKHTCNEYFSTGIDSEILGNIVEGLHLLLRSEQLSYNCEQCLQNIEACKSNVLEFSASWLEALVECGRFGLSVSFLNSEQAKKLREVLEVIKTSNEEAPAYFQHYADLLE